MRTIALAAAFVTGSGFSLSGFGRRLRSVPIP